MAQGGGGDHPSIDSPSIDLPSIDLRGTCDRAGAASMIMRLNKYLERNRDAISL
jgi:hypothetical protein